MVNKYRVVLLGDLSLLINKLLIEASNIRIGGTYGLTRARASKYSDGDRGDYNDIDLFIEYPTDNQLHTLDLFKQQYYLDTKNTSYDNSDIIDIIYCDTQEVIVNIVCINANHPISSLEVRDTRAFYIKIPVYSTAYMYEAKLNRGRDTDLAWLKKYSADTGYVHKVKRVHSDIIKQWADGAIIQYLAVGKCSDNNIDKIWVSTHKNNPKWSPNYIYRVKP